MKSQEVTICCPNCGKDGVKALKTPSYLASSTSSISSKSVTTYHRTAEKYEIVGDCQHCGKSASELQRIDKEGKPCDHQKLMERLKAQGMPLVIKSTR